MVLTELQLPTKVHFYNRLQAAANEMDNVMNTWKNLAEFIDKVTVADMDAMGVASGQLRTDLAAFRQAIDDVIALYEGGSVAPTSAPNSVIDNIRSI